MKRQSRRSFLLNTAQAAIGLTTVSYLPFDKKAPKAMSGAEELPWYRTVTRWGQVNITEKDPPQYEVSWWRNYWKRTETKGIIANAGGIVAYYPTKIPLHRKSEYLGDRDLFGDLCRAAHEDGLAVFARMDSNRAHEELYKAHPGWFALDASRKPYKADDLYITCINGPYYNEHIPSILEEISKGYHPEGFTDNSWSGLGRESICYCENCSKSFRDKKGRAIPAVKNWDDPAYREWINWNYARRLEIWDLNNTTTKAAGGVHCIWSGMNSGSVSGQARSFRDLKEICKRAEIIMLDDQARSDAEGFQHNGEVGKRIHGLLGWDKLVPESMAMYQAHDPWFRLASKPEPEARMWMLEGIAGGIQPWWHMVGAYHEDRRMYHNPEKTFRWHKENEAFLVNRSPVATVGLVWSQQNTDFYGRDHAGELVDLPWRGMSQALIRARIPYLPIHIDQIGSASAGLKCLILPNLGVISDEQAAAIKKFVNDGGSLIATGQTSLYDHWGDRRPDYALAELFGAHTMVQTGNDGQPPKQKLAGDAYHSYLRLAPELRSGVDGPHIRSEPVAMGKRHPVLKGFDETDTIPFGGWLTALKVDAGVDSPLTFIPQFPVYPPEKAWIRTSRTELPGLLLNEKAGRGRVAFLPADLDSQFGRFNLPDHGNLLKNMILWAVKDDLPVEVQGAGLVDCHLYQQPADVSKDGQTKARLILHLVNLTSAATWRQPLDEFIALGPLQVRVQVPAELTSAKPRSLVTGKIIPATVSAGYCQFGIDQVLDHEVIVIG